ncbi:glutamate racemase [Rivibacter subsaxonicus]|uniref:Glutamate racemase n=1 Tax=Rivibacter subsaxonicus TaxID=457575 RepID=A0A4Q7VPK4_9BURK|nr:glutamate racemase [Rivibacter subsaxonicus]RZT98068.1 glutamate racemase [Rivibacter subsaxonicus]
MIHTPKDPVRIGLFDSGVGGLSVLRALQRRLPGAELFYIADSAHAPYGERDAAFVQQRSIALTDALLGAGAQIVVVACNTATALAIDMLRARYPGTRFVGVEPGLKPALASSRNGRIGVMATSATLASTRFARLLAEQQRPAVQFLLRACPGLAQALEEGDVGSASVSAIVARDAGALRASGVDTVVLGCTHYPFASSAIAEVLGADVVLVDTAPAVAEQCARLADERGAAGRRAARRIVLSTTGDQQRLRQIAERWLDFEFELQPLAAAMNAA